MTKPSDRAIAQASWTLAEKVRTDLDKIACPDAFMRVAMESIVANFPPSLGGENRQRSVMRETAKRCLRSYIENGSTDKALMLSCLEELS